MALPALAFKPPHEPLSDNLPTCCCHRHTAQSTEFQSLLIANDFRAVTVYLSGLLTQCKPNQWSAILVFSSGLSAAFLVPTCRFPMPHPSSCKSRTSTCLARKLSSLLAEL